MTDQKKHDEQIERLGEALRRAIPPTGDAEPQRDLWPRMLQRMEGAPLGSAHSSRIERFAGAPWFDWALLGVAGAALVIFPALIPALLYHL
jgi:hypothetical protein